MTVTASGDNPELENLFNEVLRREHPQIGQRSSATPSAPPAADSGDTPELQELFDEMHHRFEEEHPDTLKQQASASGDTPELQELFDEVHHKFEEEHASETRSKEHRSPVLEGMSEREADMFSKVGQLTRQFHDTLRSLGFDKSLESAAHAIPDAKDRLQYIATMTENAAARVLDAADLIQPLQNELETKSGTLIAGWQMAFENKMTPAEFRSLAETTFNYLKEVPDKTSKTNDQIMEIIIAQDFQDLTGQVIKRILDMIKSLEGGLVGFLMAYSPETVVSKGDASRLENGPVVNPAEVDVVTNQQQVDDLLESLGF